MKIDNLSTNEFDDHASIIEPEADKPVDHVIFVIHVRFRRTECECNRHINMFVFYYRALDK